MEEFYRKIYLFKTNRVEPIKLARDSQLRITVEFADYTIPAGSTASAYASESYSGKVYTQSCTVDGSKISFTPQPGFFAHGKNSLQYEINNGVIPLAIDVFCEQSLPDGGDATTPEAVKPYVLRAEEAAAKSEAAKNDAESILSDLEKNYADIPGVKATLATVDSAVLSGVYSVAVKWVDGWVGAEDGIYHNDLVGERIASDYVFLTKGTKVFVPDGYGVRASLYKTAAPDGFIRSNTGGFYDSDFSIQLDAYCRFTARKTDGAITPSDGNAIGIEMNTSINDVQRGLSNCPFSAAYVDKPYTILDVFGVERSHDQMFMRATDFLPCKPGDVFFYSGFANIDVSAASVCFYKSDGSFLSSLSFSDAAVDAAMVTVPDGCAYARFASQRYGKFLALSVQKKEDRLGFMERINKLDMSFDAAFGQLLDGTNTTSVFREWWPLSDNGVDSKYRRLERFGVMLAKAWAGKTYTLRGYAAEVSSDTTLTPLDDLAGRAPAALATDTDDGGEDWAEEDPMTWYIRANALSLDDGHMNILAIEGEDGFDITGETAPVYRFSLALFKRWTEDGNYETRSYKTVAAPGFDSYERDISPDGAKRVLTWAPCFGGGLTADGKLTSGAGKAPYIFASANQGLDAARKWDGGNDGLWNDGDSEWLLDTWQLRHFDKENSGILEGCLNYNIQKKSAIAETGVKRVLLSTADAAGLVAGSTVSIGDPGENTNLDRGNAYMRNIAHLVRITSIVNVTVDGTVYAAVNLDLDAAIDTTATTVLSTMPWHSGSTDALPGHRDGSIGSLKNGKYPARIAGVEVLTGAYAVGIEPLYNVTANENGDFDYAVYVCRDSKNLSGSITGNHVDTGIRLTGVSPNWNWVKAFAKNKLGILIPRLFGGNSSGWYKSAFCGANSAGVRCPWRFCDLYVGGLGGLVCEYGYNSPGSMTWFGSPRLSGSGKKRGELPS